VGMCENIPWSPMAVVVGTTVTVVT
jgi:hypothetical protein